MAVNAPTIYVSLGSNLGHREAHLQFACEAIEQKFGSVLKSSIYETAPWGHLEQPAFLNQVIAFTSSDDPHQLLLYLQSLERQRDRQREQHWGARTLDIDILYIGEQTISTPDINVPHPLMIERRFVLIPLNELAPQVVHPVLKKTTAELLRDCADQSDVKKL